MRPLIFLLLGLPFLPASSYPPSHWEVVQTKNGANGRSECGLAAVNGKLYLLGGEGPANAIEVFDPATPTWTKKSIAPMGFNHFQPVAYANKIYVLEAFSGGGFPDQGNLPGPLIYDTEKDNWRSGATLDTGRRRGAAGAALYKRKLYLVCGIRHGHSSGTTNLFDQYDPETDTWTALPDAPHIRDHCAAAVIGDKLYIAGGRNTSYHEPNNFMSFFAATVLEVDCYDFRTGHWTTLAAPLPLGSGGGSLVNLDGKLYYMGGERATASEHNRPRKNVYYLDPSTNDPWKETDSLNEARNGMSAAILNSRIYVFGGAGGPGGPQQQAGPSPLEVFAEK